MSPVKKQNIPALIIRGILVGVIAIAIGFATAWIISRERKQEKTLRLDCAFQRPRAFEGTVHSIHRYEWDQHMNNKYFGLSVSLGDTANLNYTFERKHHHDLENFVEANDSIIKPQGTDSFIVMKEDGMARAFVLPACGEE